MGLFSVVMPVKNAAPYVVDALQSVLAQDGVDIEVIVVDDGSTDGSTEVVRGIRDPRVRIVPGPCQGIAAALNAGFEAARGDFIARCDADDAYILGRLAWQAGWLENHPEFGAVCGAYTTVTKKNKLVAPFGLALDAGEITQELQDGIARTSLCTFAIRSDLLRTIGGCRTYFIVAEDIDLQFRIAEATRVWFEPEHTYVYRLLDSSVAHTQSQQVMEFYKEAARTFQRQRLSGQLDDLEKGYPPTPPPPSSGAPLSAREQIQRFLTGLAWEAHCEGRRWDALDLGWRACLALPYNPRVWINLVVLALKPQGRSQDSDSHTD